jgi:hypothetical protein
MKVDPPHPQFYLIEPETNRRLLDAEPFSNYLQSIVDPEFVQKHLKNIE